MSNFLISQQKLSLKAGDLLHMFSRQKEGLISPEFIPSKKQYWVGSGREALRQILLHLKRTGKIKVGIPAYTCHVVLDAVQRSGCKAILYDSGVIVDVEDIRKIIQDIDVLLVCHNFGFMPMMDRIVDLCKKHDVVLVEDCAQALGASYGGKPAGSFGDYAFYSFGISKNIGFCGGLIVAEESLQIKGLSRFPFFRLIKIIAEVGISSLFFHPNIYLWTRHLLQGELLHHQLSLQYSCPDPAKRMIKAAFGKYPEILKKRSLHADHCRRELQGLINLAEPPPNSEPAWLYFVIFGTAQLQKALMEKGVEIGKMQTFQCFDNSYKKAKKAEQQVFTFALYRCSDELRKMTAIIKTTLEHDRQEKRFTR